MLYPNYPQQERNAAPKGSVEDAEQIMVFEEIQDITVKPVLILQPYVNFVLENIICKFM